MRIATRWVETMEMVGEVGLSERWRAIFANGWAFLIR